mgnify:CR=1 FL=1
MEFPKKTLLNTRIWSLRKEQRKMENVEQRYPITMAVLRNAIDRIASWKNVTPQAKTRKQSEIAVVIVALSNTL